MATEAYYRWKAAGSPYNRALPTLQTCDVVRGHGFTVYDYPNEAHQLADPAEDHTAYSETGWPVKSREWWGHAIDIMPNDSVCPLPRLAHQIIADKDNGVPGTKWIKYINWTDENGDCWHTSWQPDKRTVRSSDKGHIHVSGRSDMDASDEVSRTGWDPVARALGDDVTETELINACRKAIAAMADEGANRSTPTGKQYADDFNVMVRNALQIWKTELDAKLAEILSAVEAIPAGGDLPSDTVEDINAIRTMLENLLSGERSAAAAMLAALPVPPV